MRFIKVPTEVRATQLSTRRECPPHLNCIRERNPGGVAKWVPASESSREKSGREGDWVIYSGTLLSPDIHFETDEDFRDEYKALGKKMLGMSNFKRRKLKASDYYDCCKVSEMLLGFVIEKAKGTFEVEYEGRRIFANKDSKPFLLNDKPCGYDDYIARDCNGNLTVLSKRYFMKNYLPEEVQTILKSEEEEYADCG